MHNHSKPIPGSVIFNSLSGHNTIVLAVNPRMLHVVRGVMRAAKDIDAPIIFELARSECNLENGYTGLTPSTFSKGLHEAADEVGHDLWAIHADHIGIKTGSDDEIEATKELISAHIEAGYTSFAIDASHLFNFEGKTVREELEKNIKATTTIAKFIEERMQGKEFGLEVEVGEIGKEDAHGRVLTTPEEAVTFIQALNENGVYPQVLAIANGSTHGNVYDENGYPTEQVSIDIPRTKAVVAALKEANLAVNVAQHGITGTPRDLIQSQFPKGDIIKGNVATFWMNLVWDVFKVYEPELYAKIYGWTLDYFRPKFPDMKDKQIFGTYGKFAMAEFFDEIYAVDKSTVRAIDAYAYAESLMFFRAFNSEGTGSIVRAALK